MYCSSSDVSNHLGRSLTTQESAEISTLIAAAQSYIDRRASRTFELTDTNTNLTKYYTAGEYVDSYVDPFNLAMNIEPKNNKYLFIEDCLQLTGDLDTSGNRTISLLNEQGVVSGSLSASKDFQLHPLDYSERSIGFNSLYRIGANWFAGHRTVSIKGDWAYTSTAPAGVTTACALIVCYYIRNKQGLIKETIEGYERQFKPNSPVPGQTTDPYLDAIVDEYVPKRVRVYA